MLDIAPSGRPNRFTALVDCMLCQNRRKSAARRAARASKLWAKPKARSEKRARIERSEILGALADSSLISDSVLLFILALLPYEHQKLTGGLIQWLRCHLAKVVPKGA